ncbi:MAG: hypothetical protein LBS85_00925, partial [Clostridiales Family XIII bacterium]|nr:hypothetical protein [Clostridiales Family XIII bacterium]
TASVVTGSIVGIFLGIRSWAFSGPNDDIASNLGWNLFDRFFQNLGWLLLPIAIGIVFYAIFKRMSHSHYNRRA